MIVSKYISSYHNPPLTWVRIFGHGLCFRDSTHPNFRLTFSERNGYTKYYKVGAWVITKLKKSKY